MTDDARQRWAELSVRRRGALIRAVRRGERVAEEDRALAVALATRELDRLTEVVRPARLTMWRVLHAIATVLLALAALASALAGRWAGVAFFGIGAAVFGSSALLARRRLARQVERLAAARDLNDVSAAPQDDAPRV